MYNRGRSRVHVEPGACAPVQSHKGTLVQLSKITFYSTGSLRAETMTRDIASGHVTTAHHANGGSKGS